ncbi:hypothetical protein M9H77_29879 [Catharanthus roseus]|uniref:Uncharacterized protein n=1 Tax=Catharanthus roseus TaxID=4058 RepID=A0ACB9ZVM6_CATRO|nr:hypothetical protein M9H77_29879 [Catharanthus roseus]
MNSNEHFNLLPGDAAVQLGLIAKVHGLEQAEIFFNSLPDESKLIHIYGSLLNCYAEANALDKAEAVMEKMKKFGFARTLSYNAMLKLYYKMGDHDKFNVLVQEMEAKGIFCDQFTNNIRLSAYSAASDMVEMEKLLMKMEADPLVSIDWFAYGIAADAYLKTGALKKATMVLKKFEHTIKAKSRSHAYRVLITLYTRLGRKDEVYRIWNKLKNSRNFYNSRYITVISSLVKLDDLDGAEKMLQEWQGEVKFFDGRVPYLLVSAYCQKGHMDKAESLISKLVEAGNEPNASTWSCMVWGYCKSIQMEKAVDMLEKSIVTSEHRYHDVPTLSRCLEYLDSNGDAERAKKIIGLLEERGTFSIEFRDRLVNQIRKEKMGSKEFDEMEQEAVTLETEEIFGDIEQEAETLRRNLWRHGARKAETLEAEESFGNMLFQRKTTS